MPGGPAARRLASARRWPVGAWVRRCAAVLARPRSLASLSPQTVVGRERQKGKPAPEPPRAGSKGTKRRAAGRGGYADTLWESQTSGCTRIVASDVFAGLGFGLVTRPEEVSGLPW